MRQRIGQIALFGFLTLLTGGVALGLVSSGVVAIRLEHAEHQWSVDRETFVGPLKSSTTTDYIDRFDGPGAVRFGIARIAVGSISACWCLICLMGFFVRSEARTSRRRRRFQRGAMRVLLIPATTAGIVSELFYYPPWLPSEPTMLATAAFLAIVSGIVVLIGASRTIIGRRRVLGGTATSISAIWVLAVVFGHDDHASLAVVFGGSFGIVVVSQGLIVRRLFGPEAPAPLEPATPQQIWRDFRGFSRPASVLYVESRETPNCPAIPQSI